MNRVRVFAAVLSLAGAGPLAAQMQPMGPPPKPVSFQITGGMTIPVFSYAEFTDDIGWKAQGALIVRRGAFNHVRIEGEYNSVALETISGDAEVYGGGIGGGRVVVRGNVQSEGYFVAGAYNHSVSLAGGGSASEVQFGTKIGFNAAMGRGRMHPVIDFSWLYTWSSPYVNVLALSAGLRF